MMVNDSFFTVEHIHTDRLLDLYFDGRSSFAVFNIKAPIVDIDSQTVTLKDIADDLEDGGSLIQQLGISFFRYAYILLDSLVSQFNDKAFSQITNIPEDDSILSFFKSILDKAFEITQLLDNVVVSTILNKHSLTFDDLFQSVESYLTENTYEICYFKISKKFLEEDTELSQFISQMTFLDIRHLGLSPRFGSNLQRACDEFQLIPTKRTPFEKIKSLVKSISLLNSLQEEALEIDGGGRVTTPNTENLLLTTDQVIPLLLLVIVKTGLLNLHSNLYYMQNFAFEFDFNSGEFGKLYLNPPLIILLGYALSSLEAVLEYIKSNHVKLCRLSKLNQEFFSILEGGDLGTLRTVFFEEITKLPKENNSFAESATTSTQVEEDVDFNHSPIYLKSPVFIFDAKPFSFDDEDSSKFARMTNLDTKMAKILQLHTLLSRNLNGENSVTVAVKYENAAILDFLLSKGANINAQDHHGKTALHHILSLILRSCSDDRLRVLDMLLSDSNLNLNVLDEFGMSPLLYCFSHGGGSSLSLECATKILHVDPTQNQRLLSSVDLKGNSIFHLISTINVLEYLNSLPLTLDHNVVNNDGYSPLLHHVQNENNALVKYILLNHVTKQREKGYFDLSIVDFGERSILHFLAFKNSHELLSIVLGMRNILANIDNLIDLKSLGGNTALHAATDAGSVECVQLLLQNGSDPRITNNQGRCAVDLCKDANLRNLIDGI